jgi:phosphoribosylformylglycinamidine synthase
MIVLDGQPALSAFRLDRLNRQLADLAPSTRIVATRWIYLLDSSAPLGADEQARLGKILELAPAEAHPTTLWVVPRLGTISPWSSKATEILKNCAFAVNRVERGVAYVVENPPALNHPAWQKMAKVLHDPMTQSVLTNLSLANKLFLGGAPGALGKIALGDDAKAALQDANQRLGLALAVDEIEYLAARYAELGRDPSDAELMMFAQANSEHCRHKVFNASWTVDGVAQERSLFGMIKHTHQASPAHTLSAYKDNAAVIEGSHGQRFFADASGLYRAHAEDIDYAIKVETHNHPTAISPFAGASTGSGGEIRDEGATGRGGKPKAGLTGFSVSHLRIPGLPQRWETQRPLPPRMASAFEIMRDAPIGAASFNNEFGRPALGGYFRTFEHETSVPGVRRGYDKPIMIAGGIANIRRDHVQKNQVEAGDAVIVLGGPAMLIGLGGGAASSVDSGTSSEELDFASVQRDNPEMERRCQEVIDRCWSMGEGNPIVSIHDVGAGGLSNAIPEILHDAGMGGRIDMAKIPCDDPQLSPMQLWCNESQERYVLTVRPQRLAEFAALCERERCPFAAVGVATTEQHLVVGYGVSADANVPPPQVPAIDLPMDVLFGKAPKMHRDAKRKVPRVDLIPDCGGVNLQDAVERVLRFPVVASKSFLITIGDRSVGGLCSRDQMVGPWQVPVADCAVTLADFSGYAGEAMSMGERTPVAMLASADAARLAVGEAITNIAAAPIADISEIRLSANWMAAVNHAQDDAALFDAVRAVGMELCPALGISIPVGKDSLSMQTMWNDGERDQKTVAPVSLIVTAFARVTDVRRALTPQLRLDQGETELWLIDLGEGRNRLGGSALMQVFNRTGGVPPDLEDPAKLKAFFALIQEANAAGLLLAYHDRSDGGVLVTLMEMAFAGHCGLLVGLDGWADNTLRALFAEELGAVVQVRRRDQAAFKALLDQHGLGEITHLVGRPKDKMQISLRLGDESIARWDWNQLMAAWSETSHAMQRLRDNPFCADSELTLRVQDDDPGISPKLTFDPAEDITGPYVAMGARPRVAILREQGVNGQVEMAAAFTRAGFDAVDVHMSDLHSGRRYLSDFNGFAACGGFSYGDVLGAGRGWATSILFNQRLREEFATFFADQSKFALGVCNGCQFLSVLKEIIPDAGHWPRFQRNQSEQYEARFVTVEVMDSPSIFLRGMAGSRIPVVVAHGEGRAEFANNNDVRKVIPCLRFVDRYGKPTETFPLNPNGSPGGWTGITAADGRVTALMPHPERVIRSVQMSWRPPTWGEDSPWMRIFRNARVWVG